MNLVERKRLSRDLSGPASSVLMALILANSTVTAVDLAEHWVNQSVPTVQSGLNRLAEYGLVTNYGKREGWAVNLHQLSLWQGHDGAYLEKATDQLSAGFVASGHPQPDTPATSELSTDSGQPVEKKTKNFSFPPRSDQIRSDHLILDKKISDLIRLAEILQIDEQGRRRLVAAEADPAVLLGWYLWAKTQAWVSRPVNWALSCTLKPSEPEGGWTSRARRELESRLGDISTPVEDSPIIKPYTNSDDLIAWNNALLELRGMMTKATFNTWLSDARLVGAVGDCYTIAVRNDYARDWLEERLADSIKRALGGVLGRAVTIEFVVGIVDDE